MRYHPVRQRSGLPGEIWTYHNNRAPTIRRTGAVFFCCNIVAARSFVSLWADQRLTDRPKGDLRSDARDSN